MISFFKSRAFKYGAISAGITMVVGGGISAAIALQLSTRCSETIGSLIDELSKNITIPSLYGKINFSGTIIPISIQDIKTTWPPKWIALMSKMNVLPNYCFNFILIQGMCFSALTSLMTASIVGIVYYLDDKLKLMREELLLGAEPNALSATF